MFDDVVYADIFEDTEKQHKITKVFDIIIQTRENLRTLPITPAYPGVNTGPANS